MAGKRVVVVGAGPGGLASAMLLSGAGCEVTVLERRDRVGGRTSSVRLNGFMFDLGPTFFMYPRILEEIFACCGLKAEDAYTSTRLDPNYRLYFEGRGELDARGDPEAMRAAMAALSPEDADRFAAYLADNRAKFRAFAPILQQPMGSLAALMKPAMLGVLPYLRPNRSVDRDLARFYRDDRLRLACSFQSKYLGMSPYTCPSIFTILAFLEYEYGIFHPRGGCAAVSQGMARAAESLGATLRLNEEVLELEYEGRRPTAAVTAQGRYPCDALVLNADFSHAVKRLVPKAFRRRWSDEALENRKKYSCSTFMMYLGVNGTFPGMPHHSIFLSKAYRENLTDIERDHRLSDEPSFYVCNPCAVDPSMAPAGKTALYVLVPVTHRTPGVDWGREGPAFRSRIFRQLEKIGLTDLEGRVEAEYVVTPQDWEAHYAVHRGAVFNLSHSLDQMLFLRPHNRYEELDGVYLVGGGTHPGSGLPVIYESARISSRLLLQDMGREVAW